ncbi:MAG: hypothetical protein ACI9MC_002037 [Kiritimatiellia bacterium]
MRQSDARDLSRAAEDVRLHLVMLRGGALFLSPADSDLLYRWLNAGITPSNIVLALERAAEIRQRRRARTPLSLGSAKRHLTKVVAPSHATPTSTITSSHPIQPLVDAIRSLGAADQRSDELEDLAQQLAALPSTDLIYLEQAAGAKCRDFLLQAWECMEPWEREARLTTAREELQDLVDLLPPESIDASAEEIARGELRASYPMLSAATLHQVLHL